MPGLSICPDLPFLLGQHIPLFQNSSNRQPPWTPSSGGGWQLARQPPLSLHCLTAKLSSTPRIPPLDKQSCSLFHGPAFACSRASSTSAHSSFNAPVFTVYKLSHSKPESWTNTPILLLGSHYTSMLGQGKHSCQDPPNHWTIQSAIQTDTM